MTSPVVARTRADLANARDALPGSVAVVMTMGALHDGHASLIRFARDLADHVVVTVFVNPLQFGAGEDFAEYPRTWDADLEVCRREGVDAVFAPGQEQMYPNGEPSVRVQAGPLGGRMEGVHRPGHFDGMLTVVLKLMHLTRPDVAVFGEKDAQQLALIRLMASDLDLPVHVIGAPTVREPDGLAMSSRNRYLTSDERTTALGLGRALRAGVDAAGEGPDAVVEAARGVLAQVTGIDVDYLALVDDSTWEQAGPQTRFGRLVVAGRVGQTRLIDNMDVDLGTRSGLKAKGLT
jgi:pantoate--beta-alanine ligase